MSHYLLSIYQPVGPAPEPEVLDPIMQDIAAVNDEMRASGAWVFSAGLYPEGSATVAKLEGDDVTMTDGPYIEGKEHIGGFTVIEAPDLDAALGWASKLARAITLPIEVKPVQDGSCT